jgi:hypothetical protein
MQKRKTLEDQFTNANLYSMLMQAKSRMKMQSKRGVHIWFTKMWHRKSDASLSPNLRGLERSYIRNTQLRDLELHNARRGKRRSTRYAILGPYHLLDEGFTT